MIRSDILTVGGDEERQAMIALLLNHGANPNIKVCVIYFSFYTN
jgi:hypothetical protein